MQGCLDYIKKELDGLYAGNEIMSLARIIMENVTGFSIPMIRSDKSKKITAIQKTKVEEIVERLKRFEPIQYILGKTEFYGMDFIVDKHVLIPRPETEELVELIINENKRYSSLNILDIGTGSGCIAVALGGNIRSSNVYAWDVSHDALDIAAKNAGNNQVEVSFMEVDVLKDYPHDEKFDIIVSNPPYVLESEKKNMDENVLGYEPHLALFVPEDQPLIFYERIADIALDLLNTNGRLYFEINTQKGEAIVDMLSEKGFRDIALIKDLFKKDRMVTAIV